MMVLVCRLPNDGNMAQNPDGSQVSLMPTGVLNRNTSECFLAKNSTRHTATSSDVNIEKRDSETFQLFNHLLLREDGEVPKTPIGLGLRTRGTIWDSYKNQPFPSDLGVVSF